MIQSGDDDWIIESSLRGYSFYSAGTSPPNKKTFLCALSASVVKIYFGQE
jgi:hypothetical protein